MLKNTKLRLIWIIPNIFMWIMFFGFSTWVVLNIEGLKLIGSLSIWILAMIVLFLVTIIGSFRIRQWITEGKM